MADVVWDEDGKTYLVKDGFILGDDGQRRLRVDENGVIYDLDGINTGLSLERLRPDSPPPYGLANLLKGNDA